MAKKGEGKHPGGRPPFKFDPEVVRKVCALHPTDEELAAFLKCSVDTITRLKQNNKEFIEAYEAGRGEARLSLRRRQWAAALDTETTNNTMLIWLGKQHLGQTDKQELEHSGSVDLAKTLAEARKRAGG